MKKWLLALFVCVAAVLSAQAPERQIAVIDLKYIDFSQINRNNLLHPFQVQISGTGQTLILSGPASNVAAAEAFVRKFDVRPRNVEALFYIIAAGKAGETGAMPGELEPVIKQLRGAFAYQSFRLLETSILRGRENTQLQTSGQLPATNPDFRRTYSLVVERISITPGDKGNIVRFDRLRFGVRSPDLGMMKHTQKAEYVDAGVSADIDVREGQKVVVGKSNFDGADGTFFLIVTAKVVD